MGPGARTTDGPLYCGYFFDAETALYQVRNRYYDSSLSTFISRDPIGYWARVCNPYRYVRNNPIRFLDPFGLTECNAENEGARYGVVSAVTLTPGLKNPDFTNAALNVAILVAGLSEIPFPVGKSPTSVEDYIGALIAQCSTQGPGTGLKICLELAKLKESLQAWKGITGSVASIWTKVQCKECRCTNWFPSIFGKSKWAWVADGKEKWVQCDLAKTTWGKNNDSFVFELEGQPAGFLYDIVAASSLQEIMDECKQQGEDSCVKKAE